MAYGTKTVLLSLHGRGYSYGMGADLYLKSDGNGRLEFTSDQCGVFDNIFEITRIDRTVGIDVEVSYIALS